MLIEVKEIEKCRLDVLFESDPEQLASKTSEVVSYFGSQPIPGFRTGKATLEDVKKHFRKKIQEMVKSEMAQHAYHTVIAEKNLKPFGQPQFSEIDLKDEKFKCRFLLNSIPDVTLKEYKNLNIPKGTFPDLTETSEKLLQELRVRNGNTIPFTEDDFIQEGDSAIVNYTGIVTGDVEPTVHVDAEVFVVGQSPIPNFNENMLGMKIGERREFTALIPVESGNLALVGKELKFNVELAMASKTEPCPLDDSLAEKLGAKNLEEVRGIVSGIASARIKELEKNYLNSQVTAQLIANHEVDVPTWLSDYEAQLLAKRNQYEWNQVSEEQKAEFIKLADKNIKLSVILDKIREAEPEAQMTDEEVLLAIKNNILENKKSSSEFHNKSDDEILQNVVKSGYLPILIATLRDEYTIDFIINNSTVVN